MVRKLLCSLAVVGFVSVAFANQPTAPAAGHPEVQASAPAEKTAQAPAAAKKAARQKKSKGETAPSAAPVDATTDAEKH